jgi:hypothetical protein
MFKSQSSTLGMDKRGKGLVRGVSAGQDAGMRRAVINARQRGISTEIRAIRVIDNGNGGNAGGSRQSLSGTSRGPPNLAKASSCSRRFSSRAAGRDDAVGRYGGVCTALLCTVLVRLYGRLYPRCALRGCASCEETMDVGRRLF